MRQQGVQSGYLGRWLCHERRLRRRIFGKADVLRWLVPVGRNLERSMDSRMIRAARLADILATIAAAAWLSLRDIAENWYRMSVCVRIRIRCVLD